VKDILVKIVLQEITKTDLNSFTIIIEKKKKIVSVNLIDSTKSVLIDPKYFFPKISQI